MTDAFIVHRGQINTQMSLEEHQYRVDCFTGTVVLSVSPAPGMTWGVWMAGVMGLNGVMKNFETVEMTFVVRRRGEEALLALGHLAYWEV